MALHLRLNLDAQRLRHTIDGIERRPKDMRPAWNAFADAFEDHMAATFASEGASAGAKWAPLSPVYGAAKARLYPGAGILYRSGQLESGLTQQPFNIDVREPSYCIFGTSVPWGRYHQDGTNKMPRRPPIRITASLRLALLKSAQRWIMTGVAR